LAPRQIRPDQIAEVLPPGGLTWLQACSGESPLIRDGIVTAGEALGAMTFTGIFVPGLNRVDYVLGSGRRVKTFFMTSELACAPDQVEFLPLCYRDILAVLRATPIDAALLSVSPPDENGMCSFGPVVDFLVELWPKIPVRVAHINPQMPRTVGYHGVPFLELTAFIQGETELPVSAAGRDEVADKIGAMVAGLVPDGSTLQAGLGRIPETALASLRNHRELAIHSGLIGDSVVDLLQAGALRARDPIAAGVAIGTRRLYDAISDKAFCFQPASYTHSHRVLSRIDNLYTINSAIEVDLFGQAFSELRPTGFVSGPGGASDFAAGARGGGGLRIVALPATAGRGITTRIVAPGKGSGPVSLGRFEIDVVATEFGIADLRGEGYEGRAEALMAIAAPRHQASLAMAWREWRGAAWRGADGQ
jgi:acyl-CoA hydrolase